MNGATNNTDLVDVIDQAEKRAAFDRAFTALYAGKDTPNISSTSQWTAYKNGDIQFFVDQERELDDMRARTRAGYAAQGRDGKYAYSDLAPLEKKREELEEEKKRFADQLRAAKADLAELNRREKSCLNSIKEADVLGYEKRRFVAELNQELEKIRYDRDGRNGAAARVRKNEAWLDMANKKERIFPFDALKKLRQLKKTIDSWAKGK